MAQDKKVTGQIFISYRRDDSSGWAGRLYDRISAEFPARQIFIDVDNLGPGVDFVEAIETSVGSCEVLIAVIGKRWLISSDEEGKRRLDNPDDFVRLEITAALKRKILVIPVLVDGASMPRSTELPDDLKLIARRNALVVSPDRFRFDSDRLTNAIKAVFEKAEAEQHQREEQERLAAEQLEKERLEAEQREKDRLAEERQRDEQERVAAEKREREEQKRIAAAQRQRDEWEVGQRQREERERLEAELRQREEQNRLEPVPQSQLPCPIAPTTPPAQPEADKRSAGTPKVAHPLSPKPPEAERTEPPSPPSGATPWKSPSKRVIALLAAAAGLVVAVLVYLAIHAPQSQPPKPASIAAVTPSPLANAAPTVEEKAPLTRQAAVQQPTAQSTASVAMAIPSPSITATPTSQPTTPSPTPSVAELLAQAQRYLKLNNFAEALPLLQKAADAGNTDAMNNLGSLYGYGIGVAKNYDKSRECYQKAADAGDGTGMYNLGWLYEYGKGGAQDYGKAREWYRKAADAGNSDAKLALSRLIRGAVSPLASAESLAQAQRYLDVNNFAEALPLLQKAADAGNATAMYNLGWLYEYGYAKGVARNYGGIGVDRDFGKAREWYQKAADAGDKDAMYNLGLLYYYGIGVDRDFGKAREWHQKAADAGNADAKEALKHLKSKRKCLPEVASAFLLVKALRSG
jgi:TPR repeat protein